MARYGLLDAPNLVMAFKPMPKSKQKWGVTWCYKEYKDVYHQAV